MVNDQKILRDEKNFESIDCNAGGLSKYHPPSRRMQLGATLVAFTRRCASRFRFAFEILMRHLSFRLHVKGGVGR